MSDDRPDLDSLLDQLRSRTDLTGDEAAGAAQLLLEHGTFEDLPRAAELAHGAHQAGVDGAGRLFAMAVDRFSVARTRQQRFGTFAFQYRGDYVPAPLDGAVTDEQRRELGLGTAAELQAEIDEANKAVARGRAGQGPLEQAETFARVWHDPTEAELRARWEAEGQPVWADGDEVTFVCDRPYAGAIVGPLFEIPMWRVGDLLVLTVKVHRLAEAVFTYGFWPLDESGRPAFTERPEPDGRFRGPDARPAAPTNETVVGTIEEHSLPSTSLGRARKVTVYRPPGHTPDETLPVIYATDGQWFAAYARRVDAAIEAGTTPRCVIVAAHSSLAVRTGEYFPGYDPAAFSRHEHFFLDELIPWAESTFGVATDRDRRGVFGCSDGGAHALTMGLAHPTRFGQVIAYSSGLPPTGNERWAEGMAPGIQLCAGVLEGQFYLSTYAWHAFLDMTGVANHWTERVCGHEPLQWVEELPAAITRAFS